MTTQALRALERANRTRLASAALRRELHALDRPEAIAVVAHHLADPDEIVGSIPVGRLLRFVPRIGSERAGRILSRVGINGVRSSRRVRDLTERERRDLASVLREYGHSRLSTTQCQVLDGINGSPRTAAEIADLTGYCSSQTLDSLERRGLIERTSRGWRRTS